MDDAVSRPPEIHLYQIAYSEATRAALEPGYAMLDNLDNPRPDWYEYWPIRRFLLQQPLDEQAFYGFFSPKFGYKTGLTHAQVRGFVAAAAPRADVVLFSPQPDMGAFFLNVFEQGETFDPGFIEACTQLLQAIGRPPLPLRELVMDSRQTVFSNYFVARPAFWREWLAINEALFAICEGPDTPLRRALCQSTSYEGAQRKVFLQERVASLLLVSQPRWRSVAHDPFGFAWSASKLRRHRLEAFTSDALKLAWREQPFSEYLEAFGHLRAGLREEQAPASAPGGAMPARPALQRDAGLQPVVSDYQVVAGPPSAAGDTGGAAAGLRAIVQHVFPQRQQEALTLLDIGFGTGELGRLLKGSPVSAHWQVDGVDRELEACCNPTLLGQRLYRNLWYGSATDLPPARLQGYDMLCLFDAIATLDGPAAQRLLAGLLGSLGPDSRLVLSAPLCFLPGAPSPAGASAQGGQRIAVPAQSLLLLAPKALYVSRGLVATVVLARDSLRLIEHFVPVADPAFGPEAGIAHLRRLGFEADEVLHLG